MLILDTIVRNSGHCPQKTNKMKKIYWKIDEIQDNLVEMQGKINDMDKQKHPIFLQLQELEIVLLDIGVIIMKEHGKKCGLSAK